MVLYSFSTRPNFSIIRKPERDKGIIVLITITVSVISFPCRFDTEIGQMLCHLHFCHLKLLPAIVLPLIKTDGQAERKKRIRNSPLTILDSRPSFLHSFSMSLSHQESLVNFLSASFTPSGAPSDFSELFSPSCSPTLLSLLNTRWCYSLAVAASQTKVMSCSSIFFTASKSSTKKTCLSLGLLAIFTSSP